MPILRVPRRTSRKTATGSSKSSSPSKKSGAYLFFCALFWTAIVGSTALAWTGDDTRFPVSWLTMATSPYWAVLVLPTALWSLLGRRWTGLGLHAAGLALYWLMLGHFQLPNPLRGESDGKSIKVMSYNIKGCQVDGCRPIAAAIMGADADVVLMQEVWFGKVRGLMESSLPGYKIVGEGNRVIATRLPIISWKSGVLLPKSGYGFTEAVIDTVQGPVKFITVHQPTYNLLQHFRKGMKPGLAYPGDVAEFQSNHLKVMGKMVAASERDLPVVLGGDFNCPPVGKRYLSLRKDLQDTFAEGGMGWNTSFPSWFPGIGIDRIWADKRLVVEEARIIPVKASDHLPVLAILAGQKGSRQSARLTRASEASPSKP